MNTKQRNLSVRILFTYILEKLTKEAMMTQIAASAQCIMGKIILKDYNRLQSKWKDSNQTWE